MNKAQRQVKAHHPALEQRSEPPECVCGAEWPCGVVREAWSIPADLTQQEARDYLVNHLDGVA